MDYDQFLATLKWRWKTILGTFVLIVGITLLVSLSMAKSYKAQTTLVLSHKGIDPVTGASMPAQMMPGYMATQIDIASSKQVARGVVDQLGLVNDPVLQGAFRKQTDGRATMREWLAEQLMKKVKVTPGRESSVMSIAYSSSDPVFAARIANAFAAQYQEAGTRLKSEPLRRASAYFDEQAESLKGNLEVARRRLSGYQQEFGIVSLENQLDVETAKLNDLSSQLVRAQAESMEAYLRWEAVKGNRAFSSPDVMSSPVIRQLKTSLASAEVNMAKLAETLTDEHPLYRAARAEVGKLRKELAAHVRAGADEVSSNAQVLRQRFLEARDAVEQQKERVLEVNRTRDQLMALNTEVAKAQKAYDATTDRLIQTRLEGQANQSEAVVMNYAVPPESASSPRLMLNLAAAALFGMLLGCGIALLRELRDRRIRTLTDLANLLPAPVLGELDFSIPKYRRLNPKRPQSLAYSNGGLLK